MEKEPELYEIGYLLQANLEESAVLDFFGKLKNIIAEKGGLIISEGKNKKQTLAYPIKKEKVALFNWIKFSVKPGSIKEIKEYLNKQSPLLRFIIVKTTEEKPTTIPTIKPKRTPIKKTRRSFTPDSETPKIKEEEIDKKIEELLGE